MKHVAHALTPSDRMTRQPPAQLLAALAEVGVAPDDYALIQRAKELVDEVNSRLRERRSNMAYVVMFCAAPPQHPGSTSAAQAVSQTREQAG